MAEIIDTNYTPATDVLGVGPDDGVVRQIIIEKHVHTQVQEPKSSVPAFLAGFLTAGLLAAIGAITFLAVSDADDDGNLNFDVPTVDLQIDE
ncbi:MAG: hypothetical protein ACI9N0_000813 [Ilumatobacter sp.]|jgi:hypothetical protein